RKLCLHWASILARHLSPPRPFIAESAFQDRDCRVPVAVHGRTGDHACKVGLMLNQSLFVGDDEPGVERVIVPGLDVRTASGEVQADRIGAETGHLGGLTLRLTSPQRISDDNDVPLVKALNRGTVFHLSLPPAPYHRRLSRNLRVHPAANVRLAAGQAAELLHAVDDVRADGLYRAAASAVAGGGRVGVRWLTHGIPAV